ncbi:MAG: hypothetical protein IT310_06245 [Anaerolineales bacterium]|nr:hypothetical protein [Anaerolineales bacterium]
MFRHIVRGLEFSFIFFIFAALFSYSAPPLTDQIEKIRAYTRDLEFNYVAWTTDAALLKLQANSIGAEQTLSREDQKVIVAQYLRVTRKILDEENQLQQIYADPNIADKESVSANLRAILKTDYANQNELAPFAEAILQEQVSVVLKELGLTAFGQPIPSLLYHSTPLPYALIVSPRDRIEQIANISLDPLLPVDEQARLETNIDRALNTSSLVVPVGGIGVYPTMVMRTTDLHWLLNTISHEWIHNYLTLRPLGFLYSSDPAIRTMNETTASIAGDEIGTLVFQKYYPELANASPLTSSLILNPFSAPPTQTTFDFRAEMYLTRVHAEELLKAGEIDQAEAYMEARRQVFLQNGYLIRKINQAYFAFYGAYADSPGGAAGEDPVGPAVRALRAQSPTLADFVNTISWMTDFTQLQTAIQK